MSINIQLFTRNLKYFVILIICSILFIQFTECSIKKKILLKKLLKAGLLAKAFHKKKKIIIGLPIPLPLPIPVKLPMPNIMKMIMPQQSWGQQQQSWQPPAPR